MDVELLLNSLDAVLILGISIPTLAIALRIKQGKLRLITSLLAGFLIFHGLYHLTSVAGSAPGLQWLGSLSDLVFEPVGWLVFLAFAVYLARFRA